MSDTFYIIKNFLLEIQKVENLEDMDELVSKVAEAAYEIYPCISCNTGCYTCCTGSSMPPVYAKEWQRMREYINNSLSEETKTAIIEKGEKYISKHSELLEFIHNMVQQTATIEELKQFAKRLINDLKEESCPMHIDGKCAVYSVRPIKCRAFGSIAMVYENKVQFLSCVDNIEKMGSYLKEKKTKQIALPYWNSIENKMINFVKDDTEAFNMSVIPKWLKSDLETGKIKKNNE